MARPLDGILVVSLEQAVAGPLATCRMADAGARIIKVERPEGDLARGYDNVAQGESSYFVWLNRGKESIVLDLKNPQDFATLEVILAKADIFVQNLKVGVLDKIGLSREKLRATYPRLIMVSISGFGEEGPFAHRKAYDLLIQGEAGLASLTGGPEMPARVGVSIVDIVTGMNAYEAVLEALVLRARTGQGADIRISMFDSIADLMSVPLLHHIGGKTPKRSGLTHPSIAPYGVFKTRDGYDILISIQSDREWRILAGDILGNPALADNPDFATNVERVAHRAATDEMVQQVFATMDADHLIAALIRTDIAFGQINDMAGLLRHPHLRQIEIKTQHGSVKYPAPASIPSHDFEPVPSLGQHTDKIKREFLSHDAD